MLTTDFHILVGVIKDNIIVSSGVIITVEFMLLYINDFFKRNHTV